MSTPSDTPNAGTPSERNTPDPAIDATPPAQTEAAAAEQAMNGDEQTVDPAVFREPTPTETVRALSGLSFGTSASSPEPTESAEPASAEPASADAPAPASPTVPAASRPEPAQPDVPAVPAADQPTDVNPVAADGPVTTNRSAAPPSAPTSAPAVPPAASGQESTGQNSSSQVPGTATPVTSPAGDAVQPVSAVPPASTAPPASAPPFRSTAPSEPAALTPERSMPADSRSTGSDGSPAAGSESAHRVAPSGLVDSSDPVDSSGETTEFDAVPPIGAASSAQAESSDESPTTDQPGAARPSAEPSPSAVPDELPGPDQFTEPARFAGPDALAGPARFAGPDQLAEPALPVAQDQPVAPDPSASEQTVVFHAISGNDASLDAEPAPAEVAARVPAPGPAAPVNLPMGSEPADDVPSTETTVMFDAPPGTGTDVAGMTDEAGPADDDATQIAGMDAISPDTAPADRAEQDDGASSPSAATAETLGDDGAGGRPEMARKRSKKPFIIVAAVVAALAVLYVGAALLFANRTPRDTVIAGVDVSSMNADEAVSTLADTLSKTATTPFAVTLGDGTTEFDPVAAGLTFDAQATIDKITGFSLAPARLWAHIAGGDSVTPATTVDEKKLTSALAVVNDALEQDPVDGTVVFEGAEIVSTDAVEGLAVDVDRALRFTPNAWLTDDKPLRLPVDRTEPEVTQKMVDEAVAGPAAAVVSGPVMVAINDKEIELPVEALTANLSFAPVDGSLQLAANGEGLVHEVLSRTDKIGTEPVDASITIENGAPKIVGGQVGVSIDPATLGTAVVEAATGTTERVASATLAEVEPTVTTADIEELGINEKVSQFDVSLTADSRRTQNLVVAAEKVNGTLVKPGETFSLCEKVAPVTRANGYQEAGVIVDGNLQPEVGGGLSQMATTVYNAAYFAGMEDVQHKAHSWYISRYPAGREATLYCPTIDMKFKNTTDHGVLLQAWVADGQTHAAIWSTKTWDKIESVSGARTNGVSPSTETRSGPKCVPQAAGPAGFTITVERQFIRGGAIVKRDSVTTVYKPENRIVCE